MGAIPPRDGIRKNYPRIIQRASVASFGGVPWSRIPTLNMRPPAQTDRTAAIRIIAAPAQGCQAGIAIGVLIRSVISMGVNGGIMLIQVEKALSGSLRTGNMMNIGIMLGNMAGNDRFWASLASLQAEPTAAIMDPIIVI